jgi:hypothetical protein
VGLRYRRREFQTANLSTDLLGRKNGPRADFVNEALTALSRNPSSCQIPENPSDNGVATGSHHATGRQISAGRMLAAGGPMGRSVGEGSVLGPLGGILDGDNS